MLLKALGEPFGFNDKEGAIISLPSFLAFMSVLLFALYFIYASVFSMRYPELNNLNAVNDYTPQQQLDDLLSYRNQRLRAKLHQVLVVYPEENGERTYKEIFDSFIEQVDLVLSFTSDDFLKNISVKDFEYISNAQSKSKIERYLNAHMDGVSYETFVDKLDLMQIPYLEAVSEISPQRRIRLKYFNLVFNVDGSFSRIGIR